MYICPFFFFSSRRRHTRFKCDWSSDVCSSDLTAVEQRILGDSGTPKTGPGLVGQFWELDSDRILKQRLRSTLLKIGGKSNTSRSTLLRIFMRGMGGSCP